MSRHTASSARMEGQLDVQELHRDLGRKYRNVGSKVETIWRNFSPKQREKAMREAVGDGKVLRHSRDPSLGGLCKHIPEWNLRDITSTPEHLLNMIKFRASTGLYEQLYEGVNDSPGDRQFVEESGVRYAHASSQEMTVFLTGENYGKSFKPTAAAPGNVFSGLPGAESVFIPTAVGYMIHLRQGFLLQFLNHIVEEILELGSETRLQKKTEKAANSALLTAVSKLSIQPQPLKSSFQDILAQAVETKSALEDYLLLLRSEPVVLNQAVNAAYWTRPELVADDRGRILPVITDRHLSVAFFESVTTAVKANAIWEYIWRLFRLLDCSSDKIKRGIILQELSNTLHLEYRRTQEIFKRRVAPQGHVASKHLRRVTQASGQPKIVVKGQPADLTVSDPQLHYILRLCHPDTTPTAAVQWISKLDDHNAQHAEDQMRLGDAEAIALGDLAIVVSFMHITSTAVSMAPVSRKSGLLFTARAGELESELNTIKLDADFGDHLIPMHNLLEPNVAARALTALDSFILERTGAKIGSLYEDIVQDSLNNLERVYAEAQARQEKSDKKTTYVPLPTTEGATSADDVKLATRREKEKTRPSVPSPYTITAPTDTTQTPVTEAAKKIKVKAVTYSLFMNLFSKSEARGSISWTAFESAMAQLGFSVTPRGGSIFTFNPPETIGARPITLHRPHVSEIEGYRLLILARRLQRVYGWGSETFVVA